MQPRNTPEQGAPPANAGVVAQPTILFGAPLLAAFGLRYVTAFEVFPDLWMAQAVGWPLAAAAGFIGIWAILTMMRGGENPEVGHPTGKIIASGPYAFTRNPMYLSLTIGYIGAGFILNTFWAPILAPFPLFAIHYGVVLREERYLERVLGDDYREYRRRVRRWI